ncbi:hypothetical protein Glove_9g152 [Diversispora epigaea]|uniref:VWFA domain-containing protein n=1 Tax=Diversispora epigaea TaxID=1348612 RepID=A0A397JNA4_9GLOM|nr:hypothetical protein Glove_9g152 [Diversispora epigaea]
METKLSRAIKASNELITNLHRDGLDRGCIATFNNFLTIKENFADDENDLHHSLDALKNTAYGGTRLYDSMCDLINRTFYRNGNLSRPWIMIVVTDGNDISSTRSAQMCAEEIRNKFTKENSNFLFLIGVGDDVNSSTMEMMAERGNFTYIPVKDFYLLEYAFMLLALKVTNSLNVSIRDFSINDASVTWAEVQKQRQISQVAIDYALLIDVSGSMSDRIYGPPPPKCFAGHDLKEKHLYNWYCDVCGENGQSSICKYYCARCDFSACPDHCKPGVECKPVDYCPNHHPLRCVKWTRKWVCDEDRRLFNGGTSLRCQQCDYDICINCLEDRNIIHRFARLILES